MRKRDRNRERLKRGLKTKIYRHEIHFIVDSLAPVTGFIIINSKDLVIPEHKIIKAIINKHPQYEGKEASITISQHDKIAADDDMKRDQRLF